MRRFAALLAVVALSGCNGALSTPHAVIEKAEIDGELAYQGTVAALDADLSAGKISQAQHDAAWRTAWQDLQAFRTAYAAGQDVTVEISAIQADLAAAKAGKP